MRIQLRLFAGLRRAGWHRRAGDRPTRREPCTGRLGGATGTRRRAARCPLRTQQGVCRRRPSARRRRRAGADTAGVGWRHSPDSRSDRPGRGRWPRSPTTGGGDRDLRRHDARSLPRPDGHAPRVRGIRGHGGAGDDADRALTSRSATSSARSRSPTASGGSRSGRRASRSPSPPRTEPTPSPPARTRSTRSRRRCRSGRKRCTRAARSGSAKVPEPSAQEPRRRPPQAGFRAPLMATRRCYLVVLGALGAPFSEVQMATRFEMSSAMALRSRRVPSGPANSHTQTASRLRLARVHVPRSRPGTALRARDRRVRGVPLLRLGRRARGGRRRRERDSHGLGRRHSEPSRGGRRRGGRGAVRRRSSRRRPCSARCRS